MSASNPFAAAFLQEAADQLALVEEIVLEIEDDPTDHEGVNRLFRVFHTIKGSGAMFGFDEVAAFTHHVESVLDKVRAGSLPVSKPLVDIVLAAKDLIADLLSGNPSSGNLAAQQNLLERLAALTGKSPTPNSPNPAPSPAQNETPKTGVINTFHVYFKPESGLLGRGIDPASLLADLKCLGACEITANTGDVPTLDLWKTDTCDFSWDIQLRTDREANAIRDVFIFVEDDSKVVIEPITTQASLQPGPAAGDHGLAAPNPAVPSTAPAAETKISAPVTPTPNSGTKTEAGKMAAVNNSVRVPAEKLDRLANLVGELVINQSRLAQVANRLDCGELAAPAEDLERLVSELRDTVLGIRMMPIGTTFSRFKRLVRDLSAELGKEIDLVTEGADTELDKTVLDQLGDPLIHLMRNSIDHGITTPEERAREGKPRRGLIRLSARHEGAHVVITIEDDGRGLDKEAIRTKAIEKKLIPADAVLSDKELYRLIFLPGFSTAKTITNVSGRGVGMDVVKRQIDALRGAVDISSRVGQGTRIALTLPLTLAIIDGLLVEIQHEQFIIPMSVVMENVELSKVERSSGNGRNLLTVRGERVPYLRLRELFSITGNELETERVVIVNIAGNRAGLVVDRVLGSHQTVIQSLGRFYRDVEVASGATIMGDGRVALILDIAGLVRFADGGGKPAAAGDETSLSVFSQSTAASY